MSSKSLQRTIWKLPTVIKSTGNSKSTIYRLMAENKFPKQRRLSEGGRACGWFSDEIQDFIDSRPLVDEV